MYNKDFFKMLIAFIILIIVIIIVTLTILLTNKKNIDDNNYEEIEERNEAGVAYDRTQLNNFNFTLSNMSDDIKSKISNMDDFLIEMKEYIYINGLVQANEGKFIEYGSDYDKYIEAKFLLNDDKNTVLKANIYLYKNKYEFTTQQ